MYRGDVPADGAACRGFTKLTGLTGPAESLQSAPVSASPVVDGISRQRQSPQTASTMVFQKNRCSYYTNRTACWILYSNTAAIQSEGS